MELTNIAFYHEGDDDDRHVAEISVDLQAFVPDSALSSRTIASSTFTLPVTPELLEWIDDTMDALRNELHKYLGEPIS